jgi:hypothetical protein
MKLLALVKPPRDPAGAAQLLAAQGGLTLAEARMRLAAEPPSLLARLSAEAADALAQTLRQGGLAAIAIDEEPPEPQAFPVHRFLLESRAQWTDRAGQTQTLAPEECLAILRGQSALREETEQTVKTRSLAIGAAVITGGLKLTKTTEKTVRSTQEQTEQAIFVLAIDGRVSVLRESVLDFTCLGAGLQPGRTANMAALCGRLRAFAPTAYFDERLVRLGRRPLPFVLGESRVQGGGVTSTRRSTRAGLELLVEVMRQALLAGMLP